MYCIMPVELQCRELWMMAIECMRSRCTVHVHPMYINCATHYVHVPYNYASVEMHCRESMHTVEVHVHTYVYSLMPCGSIQSIICCKVSQSYLQLYTNLWSSTAYNFTMKFVHICSWFLLFQLFPVYCCTKKSNKRATVCKTLNATADSVKVVAPQTTKLQNNHIAA